MIKDTIKYFKTGHFKSVSNNGHKSKTMLYISDCRQFIYIKRYMLYNAGEKSLNGDVIFTKLGYDLRMELIGFKRDSFIALVQGVFVYEASQETGKSQDELINECTLEIRLIKK